MQSDVSFERRLRDQDKHGDVLTAISEGMVALMKEYFGRGPTETKTYYHDDLVTCLMRGGSTRAERTLWEGGRGAAVIRQRMDFQELMRERFKAVVESATGRQVIGFMSGNQQHPDIMCEVFILADSRAVDRRFAFGATAADVEHSDTESAGHSWGTRGRHGHRLTP